MNKKKIIGVFAVVILCIAFAVVYVMNRPDIKMLRAGKAFSKEIQIYHNPILEELDLVTLNSNKLTKVYHDSLKLNVMLPEMKSDSSLIEQLENQAISISVDGNYDYENKNLSSELGLGVQGMNALKGEFLVKNQDAYIWFPNFLEKTFYFDLKNFGHKYNQSLISEVVGSTVPEDLSIDFFPQLAGEVTMENAGLVEDITTHASKLKSHITLKNSKENYTMTINGKEEKCSGVEITISSHAINDFMRYSHEMLRDNHFLTTVVKLFGIQEDRIKELGKTVMDTSYEDVTLILFLDQQMNIRAIKSASPIVTDQGKISVELAALGAKHPYDNVTCTLGVDYGNGLKKYSYEKETTQSDTGRENHFTGACDQEIFLKYQDVWNWQNKSCDASLDIGVSGDQSNFRLRGNADKIVTGEAFRLNLAEFAIGNNGTDILRMAGEYSQEPASATTSQKEIQYNDMVELLTYTKADFEQFMMQMIFSIGSKFLLGQ